MRELRESQHMQVVSSTWVAGSDVEQTVREVRLQRQTTAHAMHLFPPKAAHISCTESVVSAGCQIYMLSTGGLVWTLSG